MTVAMMKVAAKRLINVEVEKFTIIVISVIDRSEENVCCTNVGVDGMVPFGQGPSGRPLQQGIERRKQTAQASYTCK